MSSRQIRSASIVTVVCVLALATGCNGFFVNPTLSSITVNPSTVSLASVGQTMQLNATGVFDDGSTKALNGASGTTWTSSDPTAVSVSSTGLITNLSTTGAAPASVTIAVTNTSSNSTVTGTATVCVGTSCTTTSSSVSISPSTTTYSLSASQGQSIVFTATVNGSVVTATWTSSNPSVMAIDATQGTAQILGQGTTTISAQTTSGTGSLTITVGP